MVCYRFCFPLNVYKINDKQRARKKCSKRLEIFIVENTYTYYFCLFTRVFLHARECVANYSCYIREQ